MSSAGSNHHRSWQRAERVQVRRQLADTQAALDEAIQGRDAEAITEARRAHAEALERLRDLR